MHIFKFHWCVCWGDAPYRIYFLPTSQWRGIFGRPDYACLVKLESQLYNSCIIQNKYFVLLNAHLREHAICGDTFHSGYKLAYCRTYPTHCLLLCCLFSLQSWLSLPAVYLGARLTNFTSLLCDAAWLLNYFHFLFPFLFGQRQNCSLSNGPSRVGVSQSRYTMTQTDLIHETLYSLFIFLKPWTMGKRQKVSGSTKLLFSWKLFTDWSL